MEKIINIGGKDVRLSNNVGWVLEYRDQFGKDVLEAVMPIMTTLIETASAIINEGGSASGLSLKKISGALEGRALDLTLPLMQLGLVDSVVDITWAMAKTANEDIEPPKRWLKQFDNFPLDVIVPEVGMMALEGFTSSKNLQRLTEILKVMRESQPEESISIRSSSQESSEG